MNSRIFSIITLLNQEFQTTEVRDIVSSFLQQSSYATKWMLYSDYCLDDENKPNDVISFALVPFSSIEKYNELDEKIGKTQPADIKHSRIINDEYVSFIKGEPIFNFSFLINDRKRFFGESGLERISTVLNILNEVKKNYESWEKDDIDICLKDYYLECISKLKRQIAEITERKNVKNHIDILLICILGGYFTAMILKELPKLEIFGWFPDRDKTNEACGKIAVPVFNVIQYNHIGCRKYKFAYSAPDSSIKPFYDNENRIVDIICGTLADYNIKENLVSKEKFSVVLKSLMADNPFNRIYRLFFDETNTHLSIIKISSSPIDNPIDKGSTAICHDKTSN